eukprot:RCo005025
MQSEQPSDPLLAVCTELEAGCSSTHRARFDEMQKKDEGTDSELPEEGAFCTPDVVAEGQRSSVHTPGTNFFVQQSQCFHSEFRPSSKVTDAQTPVIIAEGLDCSDDEMDLFDSSSGAEATEAALSTRVSMRALGLEPVGAALCCPPSPVVVAEPRLHVPIREDLLRTESDGEILCPMKPDISEKTPPNPLMPGGMDCPTSLARSSVMPVIGGEACMPRRLSFRRRPSALPWDCIKPSFQFRLSARRQKRSRSGRPLRGNCHTDQEADTGSHLDTKTTHVEIQVSRDSVRGEATACSSSSQDVHVPTKLFEQLKLPSSHCVTAEERSRLENWGLPRQVVEVYEQLGVRRLFEWQRACLEEDAVTVKGENLIYCAPTSGGKTLVAEVLLIRRLLRCRRKKCLFILPFVSIVEEKVAHLSRLCDPVGLRVNGHAGSKGGRFLHEDIAVCTIEKANGIVNAMVETGRLEELGVVVVDELHSVDDASRGYILELLLTKLVYIDPPDLQIIGMSATLPNAHVLAQWLKDAHFFVTNFRPVPLTEYYKIGNTVFNSARQPVRALSARPGDKDGVVTLCDEVVRDGHGVLVFCATKKQCESCASLLAKALDIPQGQHTEGRKQLVHQLRSSIAGMDPILEETVPLGVAYHHAGLTTEEREVVERGFRDGHIRVLACTTTLSAGVNLPARRVVFRSPRIGVDYLDIIRYKQAAGRAGRAGIDEAGESFLVLTPAEAAIADRLMATRLPLITSCLTPEKRGMARALLEAIASGVVGTVFDIQKYIKCTFYATQTNYVAVHSATRAALGFLERSEFIEWNARQSVFAATKLGSATFASSLAPDEGLVVYGDLMKARSNFVMSNELHLVYHLTPVFHGIEPDWKLFYWIYSRLPQSMLTVAQHIGIDEGYLVRCQGNAPSRDSRDPKAAVHRRFYVAMMLNDLIHEHSITDVSQKYTVSRGELQKLQEMSGTFSGMVGVFCERLSWWGFESLIGRVQDRLSHGVEADLVPLMAIPNVKPHRARALYNAGLRTVHAVAKATPEQVEKILSGLTPFASTKRASVGGTAPPVSAVSTNVVNFRLARLILKGAKQLLSQQLQEMQIDLEETSEALCKKE